MLPPLGIGKPFGMEAWSEVPPTPASNTSNYDNRRRHDADASPPSLNALSKPIQSSRSTLYSAATYRTACSEDEKTLVSRDSSPRYIPFIPAKFTDKLPKPRVINSGIFSLLENGDSFGFETTDSWTLHKWCLLFGVTTVFLYGLAGVACALLTWFRSEVYPFLMRSQALTPPSMAIIGRASRY